MSLPTDLHPRVAALLEGQGITSLYPPQEEAWNVIRKGTNVVAAIPTASGKSLIAYLAILHQWLRTGRKCLYIVPLRALASEKTDELRAFQELGLKVGLATGDPDEKDTRAAAADIIVCTSEKADALLRHGAPWTREVACVVADEVHLVNDASRGPTLEVILSRFRALVPDAQLVALSATVGNTDELARWLGADLVTSDWRPVELHRGTYFGDALTLEGQPPRHLDSGGDPVAALVEEAVLDGGQCLVFCSTRRGAEAAAGRLAPVVRDLLDQDALDQLAKLCDDGLGARQADDRGLLAKKLRKLCEAGVAFHTAGLDARQRRFVEDRFRGGDLKVICATPTLAAGVNTPARRVIIRDVTRFEPGRGNHPLPVMEVHQMMGRAGRPRYDPYGEAIIITKTQEMEDAVVESYLHGEVEDVQSKLAGEAALRIHTLASIAAGYCQNDAELEAWLDGTLWSQQTQDWIRRDRLEDVVWFLEEQGFIERDGNTLTATMLGKRTSDLYIDPLSALRLRVSLDSRPDLAEPPAFAVLEAIAGCPEVYPLYMRKNDYDWVQAQYYAGYENRLTPEDPDLEQSLSWTKTATLLADWIDETRQEDLEAKFQIGPGDVRLRVDASGWLLHAYAEFARAFRPTWHKAILSLGKRVEHGVREDALAILALDGVGRVRARTLLAAGFRSPADLRGVPLERLAGLPGFGPELARRLLRQVGDEPGSASSIKPEPAAPRAATTLFDYDS